MTDEQAIARIGVPLDRWGSREIATFTQMRGSMSDLVTRLRERANNEREIQKNNEAIADALSGQIEAFQRRDGSHNTFAVRLGLNHKKCAETDAKLAADWDEAADHIEKLEAALAAERAHADRLVKSIEALGAMPDGACCCRHNRSTAEGHEHEGECADVLAALTAHKERRNGK